MPITTHAKTFLTQAHQQGALFHGYILTGPDIQAQYDTAMYMGQLLNCEAPVNDDAQGSVPCGTCRSCKWIANAAHPIVQVMSRLTFENENTKAPSKGERKQISTNQITELRRLIGRQASPKEYRVLIFTDAVKQDGSDRDELNGEYPPPYEWREDASNKGMTLEWRPLTQAIFSKESANAFLKNLEEPHPQTHYFFLTHQADALLDTIVSRCQTVYIPPSDRYLEAQNVVVLPPRLSEWITSAIAPLSAIDVERISKQLETLCKEEGLTLASALRMVQGYLYRYKAVVFQGDLSRYVAWQDALDTANQQLSSYCNASYVMWNMLYRLNRP